MVEYVLGFFVEGCRILVMGLVGLGHVSLVRMVGTK
jgi:hypothetical protein